MHSPSRLGCLLFATVACLGCDRNEQGQPAVANGAPSSAASGATGMRSPFAPEPTGPTLGPAVEQHGMGARADSRDYAMTVVAVSPCVVEPHFRPAKGTIKLGVEVELSATSTHEVPANPLYAKLVDSQGESYTATLAGCAPVLSASRLAPGEKARGVISFDVPEDASGLVMSYAPFIVGSGAQELEFSLGR